MTKAKITYEISKATESDLQELSDVCGKTFIETYDGKGRDRPPEMVHEYVREKFSIQTLLHEIKSDSMETWVTKFNGSIVGYLKLIKEPPPDFVVEKNLIHLERLYFLKDYQGRGLGKALLKKAEKRAVELQVDGLWLGVWDENQEAISFYQAQGFQKAGSHNWEFEYEGFHHSDTDDVMIKRVTSL